jgi:hypothetical protein
MKARSSLILLLSVAVVSPSFGESVDSRLKTLEDRSAGQEKKIEEQQKEIESLRSATRSGAFPSRAGGGRLRLLDLSLDALVAAGASTEDDESLQTLQGGGHDPRKRGFTVQNVELSLSGAVDPYLTGEAHVIFFLDPLSGETQVELEEAFLTTTSLPHGLQLEAGHFFTEFGRLNPRHPHAWHWQDQPVISTRLFGPDGMRGPGFRLGWLMPLPWLRGAAHRKPSLRQPGRENLQRRGLPGPP